MRDKCCEKVVDERLGFLKAISFWDDQFHFVLQANVATLNPQSLGIASAGL
jgi:hypothetical protein